jgi:UDP-sulfoquinovose synthase
MSVMICGVDGYIGWALVQHLAAQGVEVIGLDNGARRRLVYEVGGKSITPIATWVDRQEAFTEAYPFPCSFFITGDISRGSTPHEYLARNMAKYQVECVVNLAQIPSAPYSMLDEESCIETAVNNEKVVMRLLWAMHKARNKFKAAHYPHLIHIGTMGEYGTPPFNIAEGHFTTVWRGKCLADVTFPRQPGSFYHVSKVNGSTLIDFACRNWGLSATDVMQGVVYGTRWGKEESALPESTRHTRLDVDECFGTVINRFVCQAAIEDKLTVYGKGGQTRGFLPLRDSIQCLELLINNPPKEGEYRVVNQFDKSYSVLALAHRVKLAAEKLGLKPTIEHVDNPRNELEDHFYEPDREKLADLGYKPFGDLDRELETMLKDVVPHRDRIEAIKRAMRPSTRWK